MKSYTHILENRVLSYIFYWIFPNIMLVLIRNESWSVNEYRAWRHMFVLLVLLFIIHGGDFITCSSWRSYLCIFRLFKEIFTCCGRNFTTIDALPSEKSLPVLFARNATNLTFFIIRPTSANISELLCKQFKVGNKEIAEFFDLELIISYTYFYFK